MKVLPDQISVDLYSLSGCLRHLDQRLAVVFAIYLFAYHRESCL